MRINCEKVLTEFFIPLKAHVEECEVCKLQLETMLNDLPIVRILFNKFFKMEEKNHE